MKLNWEEAMKVTTFSVNLDLPWVTTTLYGSGACSSTYSSSFPYRESVTICWGGQDFSLIEVIE
jgi:hypothetical protein